MPFQNAFQSGQQFALEQDRRTQVLRLADTQEARAVEQETRTERESVQDEVERGRVARRQERLDSRELQQQQRENLREEQEGQSVQAARLEAQDIARKREDRQEKIRLGTATQQERDNEVEDTERERKESIATVKNVINFYKQGIASGASIEEITQRAAPALTQLGVPEDQLQSLAEQIEANPEILDELEASLRSTANRRIFQQVEVTLPDGREGILKTFSNGETEFTEGISLKKSELATGRLAQGAERIAQREPEFRGEVKEEEKVGAARGEIRAEDLPPSQRATAKGKRAADARSDRFDLVSKTIDTAISQASGFTTGFFSIVRFIPGTPAANLDSTLKTVKANIGFAELQRLRDGSKTGGALGQVSELENLLLQAVLGSLEQSQTKPQFVFNLKALKQQIKVSDERVAQAFEQDFGVAYAGPGTPIPADAGDDIEDLLDKFAPVGEP